MTNNEKQWLNDLSEIGCILCAHLGTPGTPAEIHHPRSGVGMGKKATHFEAIPLCPEHHQGNSGVHGLGERGFYTRYKLSELDLLAMTIEGLYDNLR